MTLVVDIAHRYFVTIVFFYKGGFGGLTVETAALDFLSRAVRAQRLALAVLHDGLRLEVFDRVALNRSIFELQLADLNSCE